MNFAVCIRFDEPQIGGDEAFHAVGEGEIAEVLASHRVHIAMVGENVIRGDRGIVDRFGIQEQIVEIINPQSGATD